MNIQAKKSFAMVDYDRCAPAACDPQNGICAAVAACTHKVLKQIDGVFNPPVVFHDMCMGCWDCIPACPLGAIQTRHVS
jgi:ATP-binding cassette subfamily E protein 1